MKGGDRSHHGDGNQGHVLLQTADRLLNGGALGQQMIHQERRLQGSRMLPALFFIMGEGAVVELASHQTLFIDALIEHGGGGEKQTGTGTGVSGSAGIFRFCSAFVSKQCEVFCFLGEKRNAAAFRQPVKVIISSPEVGAVPGSPGEGAAAGVQPG